MIIYALLEDLWGEDFAKQCIAEAKNLHSEPSFQVVLMVAISKLIKKKPKEALTSKVWDSFTQAYLKRYGAPPVRNAVVNSHLKNFIQRIGAEEAPEVAAFYVTHNDPFYTRNGHSTGMLLKDAEKLRTEWKTGNKVSSRRQTNAESNAEAAGELWIRNQEGKL